MNVVRVISIDGIIYGCQLEIIRVSRTVSEAVAAELFSTTASVMSRPHCEPNTTTL